MHHPNRRDLLAGLTTAATAAMLPLGINAADLTTVNVASAPQDDVASLLYGIASGIFAKQGLDIKLQPSNSGGAAAAAIAGGSLQIAKASTVSIAIGHAHGLPFTIIAPSTVAESDKPICGLMVRPDSIIKTGKDCNGKIFVGNSLQDLTQLSTMAWVDKTGGDSKTLKFVELTQSVTIDAITTGRIDGATALNPVLYDAVSTGHVRVVGNPLDAVAPHFCTSAWFTTTDYAAKNPTVIKRFVAGLRDAVRYQYAHPTEMAEYLAPFLHDDLDRLRKMPRTTVGLTLDPKDFQPVIDLIVKYGTVAAGFPARDMLT